MRISKSYVMAGVALTLGALALVALPDRGTIAQESTDSVSEAELRKIDGEAIRAYILENPEVIREALVLLEQRRWHGAEKAPVQIEHHRGIALRQLRHARLVGLAHVIEGLRRPIPTDLGIGQARNRCSGQDHENDLAVFILGVNVGVGKVRLAGRSGSIMSGSSATSCFSFSLSSFLFFNASSRSPSTALRFFPVALPDSS